jgi:hypothetical protein
MAIILHFEINPVEPKYFGEVAKYYRHKDNGVQFGLITSVCLARVHVEQNDCETLVIKPN